MHTQGGAHIGRSVATAGILILKGGVGAGPQVEQSEPKQGEVGQSRHKAVHAQGGAHTRQSVATARVFLFKGGAGAAPASSEANHMLSEGLGLG